MNKFVSILLGIVAVTSARADTSIVFNEIMYHPATNEPAMEWVELYNQMAVSVDVSGWTIANATSYAFPSNSIIPGGGFAVVAFSPSTLAAATGLTNIYGPFSSKLSNGGETLELRDNSDRIVDSVHYDIDGDWPVAPNGSGQSLAKRDHDTASDFGANWTSSARIGGTPGAENFSSTKTSCSRQIFSEDSQWKFESSGTDLDPAWTQPDFDDSTWSTGVAWFYNNPNAGGMTTAIAGLFNTGVDEAGHAVTPGSADPHYIITAAAQGDANLNALATQNHPAWLTNDTESSWIGVVNSGETSVNGGNYNYSTRFCLAQAAPGSAQIQFSYCVDNTLKDVLLNGTSLGISGSGFLHFNGPITISTGFIPGTNTLEFRTANDDGYTPHGFRALLKGTTTFSFTNTLLASDPNTCFFRKSFTSQTDPASTLLWLKILATDGAVIYLNGTEAGRVNMPAGAVTYSTAATSNAPAFYSTIELPTTNLFAGTNVLAVEVHRAAATTNDLLFGAELTTRVFTPELSFNEIAALTNAPFWVELINHGTNTLYLNGCVIALGGSTNTQWVVPDGTSLAPGAILSITPGFTPVVEDQLFLYAPGKTQVLDAVTVKTKPRGRSPDGDGAWLYPGTPTPGASNSFTFHREVVINEIMYDHRDAGTNTEEWIELYNRGTNAVDLTGWNLSDGITFNFTAGQTIAADGYLVVAKDSTYLRTRYPAINIVGNFGKSLSHKSDHIVLNDDAGNPVSEVRYYDDGHWPHYAAGGGSSLELRDPNSDTMRAESWAASDETTKFSWQTYTYRGVAQTLIGPETWNDFVLGLLSEGECLVDDVSVVQSPTNDPVQLVANGDFENGLTGWRVLGDHGQSRVETDPDSAGNHVLHIVATGPQADSHNHVETTLGLNITNGQTYEISYRAKWLGGNNLLNSRLYFDRVARTTALPVPDFTGTPGARNSRFVTNAGPTFSQFQHQPVVPNPGNPITFSVTVQDPQGVRSCDLWFSRNGGAFLHSPMSHAGNGLYTKTIPGLGSGTIVQFFVVATDGLGACATYPPAGTNSGALFAIADGQANLSLGHNVRIIMSPANRSALYDPVQLMSNGNLPATVIYDEKEAYYDVGVRLKGSASGRNSAVTMGYHLEFRPDDLFRGVHPVMLVDRSGGGGSYPQEEIVIRHMLLHAGNIPGPQPDLCHVIPPSSGQTSQAILIPRFEDEFISTAYPHGGDGTEWEYEMIYYPLTTNAFGFKNSSPWSAIPHDISDLGDDKELYRYDFLIKNNRGQDDYSGLIALAKAFSQTNQPDASIQLNAVMDMDEWLRTYALLSLCGVADSYTFGAEHNLIVYQRPSDQRMLAFPWDMDSVFYRPAGSPLIGDDNWGGIESLPANKRRLYGHALDIIASTFNTSYMSFWINHYMSLLPGQDFSGVLTYIQQRTVAITGEIANAGGFTTFSIAGTNVVTTSTNIVTIGGTAPVTVQSILVNGAAYAVTWSSLSNWTIQVPVSLATNVLNFAGCDVNGNPVAGANGTLNVIYTGGTTAPILPEPYDLAAGLYQFSTWSDTNAAGAYPSNMLFLQVTNCAGDPGLDVEMDSRWTLPYDRAQRSRVNGLGANGFAFINADNVQAEAGSGFLGAAVLALNTLGQTNVRVAWTGGTVSAGSRVYAIRLQYRVGSTGEFTDVLDGNNTAVEYLRNETSGHSQIIGPVTLPAAVNDQPRVELRWKYYFISGTIGTRAQLRVGNIAVAAGTNELVLPISFLGNPSFYHLADGSYHFTTWNNSEPAGTYPSNMVFLQVVNSTGDPPLGLDMDSAWTLGYNLTKASRINGLGVNGFAFINTSDPQSVPGAGYLGAAALALNTLGQENIQVTWTGGTVTPNPRAYGLRLRYRVGGIGSFIDVTNSSGAPIDYLSSATAGNSQTLGPVTLPGDANNQLYVELRWIYYYISGASGARAQLRVGDISVNSTAIVTTTVTNRAVQITMPTNGVVTIQFIGAPGANYVVQTSTNLASPWENISTNTAGADGSWEFTHPNATNSQQFYRTILP